MTLSRRKESKTRGFMRLQVQVTLKNNYNGSAKHFSSGNDSQTYTGWLKLSWLMLRRGTKPVPGKGSEALGFHLHVKTIIWIKPQGHQGSSPTPEWGRRLEFLVSCLRYGVIYHFSFKFGSETYAGFIQQVCLNFATDINGDKFQSQHAKLSVGVVWV